MAQPLGDRSLAPTQVLFPGLAALARKLVRNLKQPLRSIGAAIQHQILRTLPECSGDFLIDGKLSRIHDPHAQPRLDRVIEEHGMDSLPHRVVAPEGEGHVGYAAGGQSVGEVVLDPAAGVDKVHRVVVVLFDARADGEDVGVEDDVFRREARGFREQGVGAGTDLRFPR